MATKKQVPVQILDMIKADKERIKNFKKLIRKCERWIEEHRKKISQYEENILKLENFIK